MNKAIEKISLDTHLIESQYQIPIKQYDTSRAVYLDLRSGDRHFVIDDGCRAVVIFKIGDTTYLNDCTIDTASSTVIFNIPIRLAEATGLHDCELRIYGDDGTILTSPVFTVLVSASIYDDAGSHGGNITVATVVGLTDILGQKLDSTDVVNYRGVSETGKAADAYYVYNHMSYVDQELDNKLNKTDVVDYHEVASTGKAADAYYIRDHFSTVDERLDTIEGQNLLELINIINALKLVEYTDDMEHSSGESYESGAITFSTGDTMSANITGSMNAVIYRLEKLEKQVYGG